MNEKLIVMRYKIIIIIKKTLCGLHLQWQYFFYFSEGGVKLSVHVLLLNIYIFVFFPSVEISVRDKMDCWNEVYSFKIPSHTRKWNN